MPDPSWHVVGGCQSLSVANVSPGFFLLVLKGKGYLGLVLGFEDRQRKGAWTLDTQARSEPASCRRLTKLALANIGQGICL